MDPNYPAIIIVKRNWHWMYGAVSFDVSIDDRMFGRLTVNEIKQFFVEPGVHKLYASVQGLKSPNVELTVQADSAEVLECGAAAMRAFLNPTILFKKDQWIYLRKSTNATLLEAAAQLVQTEVDRRNGLDRGNSTDRLARLPDHQHVTRPVLRLELELQLQPGPAAVSP